MFTVTPFASCDNLINHNNKTCFKYIEVKIKIILWI